MDNSLEIPDDSSQNTVKIPSLILNLDKTEYIPNTIDLDKQEQVAERPALKVPKKVTFSSHRKSSTNIDGSRFGDILEGFPEKRKPAGYQNIMIESYNCERLVEEFLKEPIGLRMSDAANKQFDFQSSFARVKEGYPILTFSYATGKPEHSFVSIDGYGILVKRPFQIEKLYSYEMLGGILIGATSSTFKKYFMSGGSLKQLALEETDCFSILAGIENLDFGTHSDTAKYDIVQIISFYLASRTGNSSPSISLKHLDIVKFKFRVKMQDFAKKRSLNTKEAMILAMVKSLILRKENPRGVMKLKAILNRSYRLDAKLHRLGFIIRPFNFKMPELFKVHIEKSIRATIMTRLKLQKMLHGNNKVKEDSRDARSLINIIKIPSSFKIVNKMMKPS